MNEQGAEINFIMNSKIYVLKVQTTVSDSYYFEGLERGHTFKRSIRTVTCTLNLYTLLMLMLHVQVLLCTNTCSVIYT